MKQIIIFLLIIILAVIGYGQYKKYKRFSLEGYQYKIPENIDVNYHDKDVVYNYQRAVQELNGYVISQWSANDIDVRNPEDDDESTLSSVSEYNDKVAKVKYYEGFLAKSAEWKAKGLSNDQIVSKESNEMSDEAQANLKKKLLIKNLFERSSKTSLRIGDSGALVYEIQKLLVAKGFDIPTDGIFKNITADALKEYESKHNLFPDGKLDAMTLNALLK